MHAFRLQTLARLVDSFVDRCSWQVKPSAAVHLLAQKSFGLWLKISETPEAWHPHVIVK